MEIFSTWIFPLALVYTTFPNMIIHINLYHLIGIFDSCQLNSRQLHIVQLHVVVLHVVVLHVVVLDAVQLHVVVVRNY